MHTVIAVAVAAVIGAGCGYGFRGWIARKKEAAVQAVKSGVNKL